MKAVIREKVTKSSKRRPHIFLSHNHRDKPTVRRLAQDLNRYGIDVWLDEWEIEIGESLHQSVGKAIEKSKYVGIAITPNFVNSDWCEDEMTQALAKEKREKKTIILPLLLDNAEPIPFIDDRLYLDFSVEYFKSLAHLGGLIYGASPRLISGYLNSYQPESYDDVEDILKELGWDGWRTAEINEFKILSKLIDKAIEKDSSIERMVIYKEEEKLSYYKGLGKKLLKIFPSNPIIKKLFEE